MISIIAFIFTLGLLVFVHELGHYLAARSVGVKVEKFYIGFNIFGYGFKKTINGTEYGIGWLPLGGYVKLAGMLDESFDTSKSDKPSDFNNKPAWAKIWVMSAGVLMNFLLAVIIFSVMTFNLGIPEPSSEPIINNISEGYPAHNLGIVSGDKIIQIDDQPIIFWEDLSNAIHSKPDTKIFISWEHNGSIISDSVTTSSTRTFLNNQFQTIGVIGVSPNVSIRDSGVLESLSQGINRTGFFLNQMIVTLYSLATGDISYRELSGPVMIAKIAGESAKQGIVSLFFLIAFLSINLGLVNILPIPGLDGGHVLITLIELVLGHDLSLNVRMFIQQMGILFLLFLFIIIMINDISRLF
tara:strand:+ start:1300 stop:2364 length:1065 start_codon:yes stop_codon:yes gene_type:complete